MQWAAKYEMRGGYAYVIIILPSINAYVQSILSIIQVSTKYIFGEVCLGFLGSTSRHTIMSHDGYRVLDQYRFPLV